MKTIRIISGAYGWHDKNGSVRPKKRGDEFEVDDGEAIRLVDLGIAQIAGEKLSDDTLYGDSVQSLADVASDLNEKPTTPDVEYADDEDEEEASPEDEEEANTEDEEEANTEDEVNYGIGEGVRPDYSMDDTPARLREIASSVGVKFPFGATKEEMVGILDDYFDSVENPEDGQIELTPADPE